MAKKKNVGTSATPASPSSSRKSRITTEIENAENGFVIRVCSEGKGPEGKYESKKFVAPDHASALRIANQGMLGMGLKSGKKKTGKGKRIATKKV